MKRLRFNSNATGVKKWYLNHYFLLISYVALLFAVDFLRYHYKNEYLIVAINMASYCIIVIFLNNFLIRKLTKVHLYLYILLTFLSVFLSFILFYISNLGFSYYREKQLRNNYQLSTGKITGRFITTSKFVSYSIEFEFTAGDKTVKDKKYLPKEEWDLYEGKEEVSVFYVPDLPLNNELMRP